MEEILRRQARTFEHMFDGVVVTDLAGRILDCNPGAEKMFGHARDALLGKSPDRSFSPAEDSRPDAKDAGRIAAEAGGPGRFVFGGKTARAGLRKRSSCRIPDEYGRTTAAIFIHRDITERKELERQLAELAGRYGARKRMRAHGTRFVGSPPRSRACRLRGGGKRPAAGLPPRRRTHSFGRRVDTHRKKARGPDAIDAGDESSGIARENDWIFQHYGRFRKKSIALASRQGRRVDVITVELSDHTERVLYFDITDFFGK